MHIRSGKKYSGDIYLQDVIGIDREGNEVKVEDKIADEDYSIDEQVDTKMKVKQLYVLMKRVLKGREKRVLEMRYGLGENDELTQREVAMILGISRSYVSRIEKKAIKKLSREMTEWFV